MADWTLTHGSTTQTLADWGVTAAQITEQSFSVGMLTLIIEGDMTQSIPWVFKDKVVLSYNGTVVFRGITMPFQRIGEGKDERIQCEFADPWWWLGQAAYTQEAWDANSMTANNVARIALFAEVTAGVGWSTLSIGPQVEAIIAHCNSIFGGDVMQMGSLTGSGFAIKPIPQRLENVTHEAALRHALQWVPDAVPGWDHSTDPPTLNIIQRSSASARSYAFGDGTLMMSQKLQPRPELAVLGVRIIYMGVDSLGNPTMHVDEAGATSGANVVETIIDTANGAGGAGGGAPQTPSEQPAVDQTYTIESFDIPPNTAAFWRLFGDAEITEDGDIVGIFNVNTILDPDAPENEGHSDLGGCDLVWSSGQMPSTVAAAHSRVALTQATLKIETTVEDPEDSALTVDLIKFLQCRCSYPVTDMSGDHTLPVRDTTTTMPGGAANFALTYAPTGLAAQLLAAWGVIQWDGSFVITEQECSQDIQLGNVVNITGNLTEWVSMNAQVKCITRDILSGTTTVDLGVADHLSIDEVAQLIRFGRITPATDMQQQAEGTTPNTDPASTEMPEMLGPCAIKNNLVQSIVQYHAYSPTEEFIQSMIEDS